MHTYHTASYEGLLEINGFDVTHRHIDASESTSSRGTVLNANRCSFTIKTALGFTWESTKCLWESSSKLNFV